EKLRAAGIFTWSEVEQFCNAFFVKNKSNAAIANICKPAVERWQKRYRSSLETFKQAKGIFERTRATNDPVLIGNAENSFKACKQEKDALDIFKKDLGTFVRFYEFMSQIVDYDDKDLEKLSLFARNLRPMLREAILEEDEIDLHSVVLSHYRLSVIRQQNLVMEANTGEYGLTPGEELGSAKAKDKEEDYLSQIINRLNELFVTDELSEKDLVSYVYTIRDKVSENALVMSQINNNTAEQAMLGDFSKAIDNAVMDSSQAHQNQMMQILSDPNRASAFARVVFDLLKVS
ncbi:MAG: type I restriction endonuclease subunit R, partial [Gallionella sp.]